MNIEEWLQQPAERIGGWWHKHRVTVLVVLVVNLALVVLLLAVSLQGQARFVESDVLFALEEPPEETVVEQAAKDRTERAWERETARTQVRNIAVDRTADKALDANLQDEKNIDAEELYREAARVRAQMEANREKYLEADRFGEVKVPNTARKQTAPPKEAYKGPSVVSYSLPGRKAYELPVPSYMCETGGLVVVDIVVGSNGRVVGVEIDVGNSASDPCLHEEAKRAAMRSLFTPSEGGAKRQKGSITYMFVAQ